LTISTPPAMTGSVSVVLCTYNGGRFLEAQLRSIEQQTRLPDEVVVCDDRSNDRTVPLLRAFAARAPFPVRISENRERLGSTGNFDQAIRLARGEYIALCDQDDQWTPDKLLRQASVLDDRPDVGGVFSDAELIDETSKSMGRTLFTKHKFHAQKQRAFLRDPVAVLLRHDVVTGATLMFRTSMRERYTAIPDTWVHDAWLAWILALHCRISLIDECLIRYRIHANQQIGVGCPRPRPGAQARVQEHEKECKRIEHQFRELLGYLRIDRHDGQGRVIEEVARKIAFLERRGAVPGSFMPRMIQLLQWFPSYRRYARGLSSLYRDLLLN
jgi:hypothetical protein